MPELIPAAPLSPEWHAARRAGVTAADIVTILGLSAYDSMYSLFWRKLGQVPDEPDNDRMALGRVLEPYVVERWHFEHPDISVGFNTGQLFRNRERPWQMASPDKVLWNPEPFAVLEVKTWADGDKRSWDDGPPARVRAQVLWQMDVMDVAAGHVGVVFLPSGEFRNFTLMCSCETERDTGATIACDLHEDIMMMRAAGEEFMARLRLELPPPDPDSSAATLAAVRARFARQPDKQADVDGTLWAAWSDARDVMKSFEDKARGYEAELREQAGEATILTVDGQPVARRIISDAQVKAHTRHQDYLKRIKQDGDDGA